MLKVPLGHIFLFSVGKKIGHLYYRFSEIPVAKICKEFIDLSKFIKNL
jgi:hypothetical protein